MNILYCIITAVLLQSCCVYDSSRNEGDKKITEVGIAPYGHRPMAKGVRR